MFSSVVEFLENLAVCLILIFVLSHQSFSEEKLPCFLFKEESKFEIEETKSLFCNRVLLKSHKSFPVLVFEESLSISRAL